MATGEGGEKKKGRRRKWLPAACLPRPGCFTVSATDEGPSGSGSCSGSADEGGGGSSRAPTHLIVTVNGIVGSADNWGYAAKHFIRKHPEDVVVHCSGCNSATRTFDGVDVMGRRLAEEVISVAQCRPELQKISFVAHSLGGLIARYAIALLYEPATQTDCHGGGWSSRAMVLPATLSRDAGARSDPPQDGQGEAGPPRQRRPPAFYSSVFAQIEEVGWGQLVSATGDDGVSCLTFRVVDEQRRHHLLEITLPMNYPACPPSIVADVPYLPKLQWSKSSRLKDVLFQFQEHLKVLQDYWSTMDGIDKALWVVDPTKPTYAMSHRRIALGDDCYILLHVDAHKPNSLPECRFLGTDGKLERLIKNWRKNRKRWSADRKFHENLATVLDFAPPQPPSVSIKDDQQADCGICYATHLPVDDELGTQSGCAADYKCENPSCSRAFHSVCLRDWLRTITTTRQSFDVLFGNCPYCSEPVAVKSTDS